MTEAPEQEQCPRCMQPLKAFPEDIGAASRVTTEENDKRICGACGMDEALRDSMGLAPVPLDEWPVAQRMAWTPGAA